MRRSSKPSTAIARSTVCLSIRCTFSRIVYQALIPNYYETGKSPLPCSALSSSCFIDAYWNLFACSIWDAKVGNLRESQFDLQALWNSDRRRQLRQDVVEEHCSHCWTPCEAYPTILGNLGKAALSATPLVKKSPVTVNS